MSAEHVLIVEDDAFKLDRISDCLRQLTHPPSITVVKSVQTAVAALAERVFDVVLLDMALPSHELRPGGGPPSSLLSGGMEVIMELSFLNRSDKVIVITQYPEVEIEGVLVPVEKVEQTLRRICPMNLVAVIHYKNEETNWEVALISEMA